MIAIDEAKTKNSKVYETHIGTKHKFKNYIIESINMNPNDNIRGISTITKR